MSAQAQAESLIADHPHLSAELLAAYAGNDVWTSPHDLVACVERHRAFADVRLPGQTLVRGDTVSVTRDGQAGLVTVFEVVTDDVLYIVESLSSAVRSHGHEILRLLHPQLRVVRDAAGRFGRVGDDGISESWVRIEIPAIEDQAVVDAMAEQLWSVLLDVQRVNDDADAMLTELATVRASLVEGPQLVSAVERAAVSDMLDWLADGNFLVCGYRRYALVAHAITPTLEPDESSGLGILRGAPRSKRRVLSGKAAERANEPRLLIISKANSRSTLRRDDYLDYIGIKMFDESGTVTGEHRFVGMFTPKAQAASIRTIPFLADKLDRVEQIAGFDHLSFSAMELDSILEQFPRDDLFQAPAEYLADVATQVVAGRLRGATSVFVRPDDYGRFMSCVVFMPTEHYTTAVRKKIHDILMVAYRGVGSEFEAHVGDSPQAMVHFTIRMDPSGPAPQVDVDQLADRVRDACRTWESRWADALRAEYEPSEASRLAGAWLDGLDEAYRTAHQPRLAAREVGRFEALRPAEIQATISRAMGSKPGERRLRLLSDRPIELSEVLPILSNFGLSVIDEHPYTVRSSDGRRRDISDLRVLASSEDFWQQSDGVDRFGQGLLAVLRGDAESDKFNMLIGNGLTWHHVSVIRALAAYLQQTTHYSRSYIETVTLAHPDIVVRFVDLFEARFSPEFSDDRDVVQQAVIEAVQEALADVRSLDHDRILRDYLEVISAIDRTNAYCGDGPLAFKLAPQRISHLPAPRPHAEIWVYGPSVEGIHLRFGPIARGGLRWSDRLDDFRTEVLGLVKAQMVKNAIIVPTGAKGGFVAKQLPDPARDRAAWQQAGRAAYTLFIAALLSVTDNLIEGEVVHPDRVVCHDDDDPYLVVAADKGTATFSDLANSIAIKRGFWLGDAFASGGSTGYDHKEMGITARGAWESVKRHFVELGINPEAQDISVVGIGDMSGDVFGNGLLRSPHMCLVAAFDHRHIFIDPHPQREAAFEARQRLFATPGSSWDDYPRELISAGGGVFSRTDKSLPISPEMRELFGLDADHVTPAELIRAMLTAPVDLLWNGGIGTYVKASSETDADIGDPANAAVRVNGRDLRCRVVGEGGNLGFSQRGRIEAAQSGVAINTDAIDNSAGVESSDHEVNLKILLSRPVQEGRLSVEARNELLRSMAEDVAANVLRTNYVQNVLLSNARHLDATMLGAHERLMASLEREGVLDRTLEALPSSEEIRRREIDGHGLTSPEFSVLIAYAKLSIKAALLRSDVPDDPWFEDTLRLYFPAAVHDFTDDIAAHPLRREIIATRVANSLVNRGGITFVQRAVEDTGASEADVVKAFVIARQVLELHDYVGQVEQLDGVVDAKIQSELYLDYRRLVDRVVRYLLGRGTPLGTTADEIDRYHDVVAQLRAKLGDLLADEPKAAVVERAEALMADGVPEPVAVRCAGLLEEFSLLGITDLARDEAAEPDHLARLYFAVGEAIGRRRLLGMLQALPLDDRWDAVARSAMRMEFYRLLTAYTRDAARFDGDVEAQVAAWRDVHEAQLREVERIMAEVASDGGLGQAWVVLRGLQAVLSGDA